MSIIKELKSLAKERGITNTKLAEITGIKRPNIIRFFSEKHSPSLENIKKICKALNADLKIIQK